MGMLGELYTKSFATGQPSTHSAQLLAADTQLREGRRMTRFYRKNNGGCYLHKSRDECCKYKDGRMGTEFEGHNCIPSKPGVTMNGNVCEPEGWEVPELAGSC